MVQYANQTTNIFPILQVEDGWQINRGSNTNRETSEAINKIINTINKNIYSSIITESKREMLVEVKALMAKYC